MKTKLPTNAQLSQLEQLRKKMVLLQGEKSLTDVALIAMSAILLVRVMQHSWPLLTEEELQPYTEPGTEYFNSFLQAKEIFSVLTDEKNCGIEQLDSQWVHEIIRFGRKFTDSSLFSGMSPQDIFNLVVRSFQRFENDSTFRQFLFKNDLVSKASHYGQLLGLTGLNFIANKLVIEPNINAWMGIKPKPPNNQIPFSEKEAAEAIEEYQQYNKSLYNKRKTQTLINSVSCVFIFCISDELGMIFLLAIILSKLSNTFERLHSQASAQPQNAMIGRSFLSIFNGVKENASSAEPSEILGLK